jgi:SPP1 family predicted phage head-tail adaptor
MGLTAKYTEQITIQKLISSATTTGAPIETWQDYRSLYCSILEQKGNTDFTGPGNIYNDNIRFYLRFIPVDLRKGFRIKYKEQFYSIINSTVTQLNKDIIIDCKATL